MQKAKDTEYGGILYRSRLEADWAEFFDQHSLKHKYEYQRIDLGTDRYTPDFWLPEFGVWVEIKPFRFATAHSKCYRLAIETRRPVLLIQGDPEYHDVALFEPNVRLRFTFRTVVSKEEIKPTKQNLNLKNEFVTKGALILTCSKTNETTSFVREKEGVRYLF